MFDLGSLKGLRVLRWNFKEMLRDIPNTSKTQYLLVGFQKGISAMYKERPRILNWNFEGMLRGGWRAIWGQIASPHAFSTYTLSATQIKILERLFFQTSQKV